MNGARYEVQKADNGKYYFELFGANGKSLGTSRQVDDYETIHQLADAARFALGDGRNYRETQDSNVIGGQITTEYGFHVRDSYYELVLHGQQYSTRSNRTQGIKRCIKYANSPVVDSTLVKAKRA